MKKMIALLGVISMALCVAGTAYALDLGTNITIYDGRYNSSYPGTNVGNEDSEVEPGNVWGQSWDLEGVFIKDDTLSLVGGYDFKNGCYSYNAGRTFRSGDIFIDDLSNGSGYDYVLDLNFSNSNYDVIQLVGSYGLSNVYYYANRASNPWRLSYGGTLLLDNEELFYGSGYSNAATGFTGGSHYLLQVNLSFLSEGDYLVHYTMECGNDNLMGSFSVQTEVPEPISLALVAMGGLGILRMRRSR